MSVYLEAYSDTYGSVFGSVEGDQVVCAPKFSAPEIISRHRVFGSMREECLFSSTKEYTAECPDGLTGDPVTRSATRTSTISQAHADHLTTEAAQEAAEADLECI